MMWPQLVPFVGAGHTVLRTVPKPLEHYMVERIAGLGQQKHLLLQLVVIAVADDIVAVADYIVAEADDTAAVADDIAAVPILKMAPSLKNILLK